MSNQSHSATNHGLTLLRRTWTWQALEGTGDDSAMMEPNEHLAVFFGLYGRLWRLPREIRSADET